MWYLKVDTLLLMLAAAAVFVAGSLLADRYAPGRKAAPWLLGLDLAVLVYVSRPLAAFYGVYTLFSWGLVRALSKVSRGKKPLFAVFCLLDLIPFFYTRAAEVFPDLPALFVLIGFAYNMLKAVDALFYTYYTQEPVPFLTYANFLLFFPVITGGPIFRYRDFLRFYEKPRLCTLPALEEGVKRFIRGMFKKLVLAAVATKALQLLLARPSGLFVTAALAVISWFILYFDMSGYADVAIALSTLMGVPAPENFKQPWTAASFTQFWRKWHVTLSDWIREHIFVVLNGKKLNRYISAAIGMATMLVMGLWHGMDAVSLTGSLFMGTLLALENLLGLTSADRRRTDKWVFALRCAAVNGLFAVNAMFFTMSGSQILQAAKGVFGL